MGSPLCSDADENEKEEGEQDASEEDFVEWTDIHAIVAAETCRTGQATIPTQKEFVLHFISI